MLWGMTSGWGLLGAALAVVIIDAAYAILSLAYVQRYLPGSTADFARKIAQPPLALIRDELAALRRFFGKQAR
jgi:Na+-driven multidrug efflux pump